MIQHIVSQSSRQALRKRREVQKLIKLIRVINCVAPNVDLPRWNPFEHFDSLKQKFPNDSDRLAELNKIGLEFYRRLPKGSYRPIQEFIGPVDQDTLLGKSKMYNFLGDARETLREIAAMGKGKPKLPVHLRSLVGLEVNREGKIEITPNPILKALLDVEVARIRQCPICRKIFWASRKDQPCCNTECAGVLRIRRWREKYPEKYKPQRIRRANRLDATGGRKRRR